ncbi:MAG: tetratricopeptide repeat protein [Flammeovirgaceae bacterium]|nr:tetratricopeptide repeat protein [Flammeovirgaceae bacterium]
MAKVIQFPGTPSNKFELQRVRKRKGKEPDKSGQLHLFAGGRVVKLNQLPPFEEALEADDQNDLEKAKLLYQKAIEEQDNAADSYCNLGILEYKTGNYTKAIDCFTRCLAMEPRHFEAHYNLANLYAEVGNLSLAKIHYEMSIEVEPTFANSYFNLGLTLAMKREFAEAVGYLKKYRQLTPQEEHTHTDAIILQLSSL